MLLVWICFHVLVAIAFQNSENRVPELAFQNSEYCAAGDFQTYPPCPFVIYKRGPTLSEPVNTDSVNNILELGALMHKTTSASVHSTLVHQHCLMWCFRETLL